jgi:DNA-directed RNA polymerase specialized sigma24 family protein
MAEELNDEAFRDLFARFLAGDREAHDQVFVYLDSLVSRFASPVLRGSFQRLGRLTETGDLRNDVLVELIPYLKRQGPDGLAGVDHARRLAGRVLRNILISQARLQAGHREMGGLDSQAAGLGLSSGLEAWRERVSVHELIDRLDPDDQDVLDVALYTHLHNGDLARSLSLSEGQASRRLAQAKERLGALIQAEGWSNA